MKKESNLYYVKLNFIIMKIFWIQVIDLVVKNVLPLVVNLLTDYLEKKVTDEKKRLNLL